MTSTNVLLTAVLTSLAISSYGSPFPSIASDNLPSDSNFISAPSASSSDIAAPSYTPTSASLNSTTYSAAAATINLTPTSTTFVGNVTSLSSNIVRDLGWRGSIGDASLYSYGDSLWCSDPDEYTCNIFASNTAALGTSDPLKVQDFNTSGPNQIPLQFCPFIEAYNETPVADWGMGISNVVGFSATQGLMLFWLNYRPPIPGVPVGSESQNHYLGGGLALVDNSELYPVCLRQQAQYWDADKGEPLWGDHGLVDGLDGYIYAFGGANGSETDVYMARVPTTDALNADKFEYWNGEAFTPDRLYNPGPSNVALTGTNAGSIWHWDEQDVWVSLSRSPLDLKGLTVRTAPALTGPWSDETTVYQGGEGTFIYGPVFHPEFQDPAKQGKDWYISFTGLPNIQQMVKLEFA